MDLETRHLRQLLTQANELPEVLLLKQTTASTNDDVREIALSGVKTVLVCSETQTQGRGQHQREWVSPIGNIYLSTLLETRTPLDGRLALEIALNILQMPTLKNLPALQIKWPNDLYSSQGKWGGILVEPISPHQAIVGIGINLFPIPKENVTQQATSIMQLGLQFPNRIQIIAEMYLAIQQAGQWFDHGCYNLAARFNHYAAFMDQQVYFEQIQNSIEGIFKGISDDGALNLLTAQGLVNVYQGRLRLAEA
ncbi:biotin--[acetyl-CoA-carboxylase] ligase [Acinetobacter guillouiae]|jgi:BirA family biotin operon repressor/biotin-[acetyl-CoA-carboxylase] ligase|uniref:biotin--[biotin carboxyl-carrier protein] ligase n=1 Tax=Acinetobacter guillouiae TaxID=106649 RepID=A0A6A1RKK2_ACIGI|nr:MULTISPECIES: biotin--[acetyl-CoA-carboxylase] ligase [Acinetobacter]ENU57209.1 biotin-[acetyl-CoA-carboxylase] ligase [Acinetobacter guillouiae CIP 63.46]EPH36263.1 Biotin-protein ligase [Acinetobacter guillouiae MSP4-18]KAB0624290.1 biotin--[acetyl-CoA-carboxylase] ligase [Acinetobacter guillouiae]MCF0266811.1 biotin--[acetyl-CoA-carboxylase] ligase [Acinetobacter guillouiae]QLD62840.1 biotin--[acetyl-CoA-carboxylase] ligase [Acinetobacter sp. MYb10]